MFTWEEAYRKGRFSITTYEPSSIVRKGISRIHPPSMILDLGCGNGRNAVYAAKKGMSVRMVDIASINPLIPEGAEYLMVPAMEFGMATESYDGIIATRLLQYLDREDAQTLLFRMAKALKKEGLLMLSYTSSGGILDRKEIRAYSHGIGDVRDMANDSGLEIMLELEGPGKTTHVPYEALNTTHDLLLRRRQ